MLFTGDDLSSIAVWMVTPRLSCKQSPRLQLHRITALLPPLLLSLLLCASWMGGQVEAGVMKASLPDFHTPDSSSSYADSATARAETELETLSSYLGSGGDVLDPSTQTKELRDAAAERSGGIVSNTWGRAASGGRGLKTVLAKHPHTAWVPLVLFAVAVTVGLVGVWAGCNEVRKQRVLLTADTASTSARETSYQLQLFAAPVFASVSVIREQPRAPRLLVELRDWMAPLVTTPGTSGIGFSSTGEQFYLGPSLTLYPAGLTTAIYPLTPHNLASLNYNILDNQFSSDVINFAAAPPGTCALIGPVMQAGVPTRFFSYFVNVWLPSTNPNETWGMDQSFTFPWAKGILLGNQTQPPWKGPCGAKCAPQLQADGTYLVFWGFVGITVNGDSMINRLDSLSDSSQHDTTFNYLLYRKDVPTGVELGTMANLSTLEGGQVIIAETEGASHRALVDAQSSCANVTTSTQQLWVLCVTPVDSYYPAWRTPASIAVVFASLVLALMMFALMVSHANHKGLVGAMLPPKAVRHLSLYQTYAEPFQMVTILFSDIVSYTELSSQLSPMELVRMLDQLYSAFDDLVDKHGLYKVETIGDAFMCVGGAPDPCNPFDAAQRMARMALDMIKLAETFETSAGRKIQIRVGMHTGNVTAAVMGRKMPHWCLVGDAVNVSSRMESNSRAMQVHVSSSTAHLLARFPEFKLRSRGVIDVKGKGPMSTFWLTAAGQVSVALQEEAASADSEMPLCSLRSCPSRAACLS